MYGFVSNTKSFIGRVFFWYTGIFTVSGKSTTGALTSLEARGARRETAASTSFLSVRFCILAL